MNSVVILRTKVKALSTIITTWKSLCEDAAIDSHSYIECPIEQQFRRSTVFPRNDFGDIKIKSLKLSGSTPLSLETLETFFRLGRQYRPTYVGGMGIPFFLMIGFYEQGTSHRSKEGIITIKLDKKYITHNPVLGSSIYYSPDQSGGGT
jgi:hypothetical protein